MATVLERKGRGAAGEIIHSGYEVAPLSLFGVFEMSARLCLALPCPIPCSLFFFVFFGSEGEAGKTCITGNRRADKKKRAGKRLLIYERPGRVIDDYSSEE
jgi:hypothetical protein